MKEIACCADSARARARFGLKMLVWGALGAVLAGCAAMSTSVGVSVPIGRAGGVGVSVGSGGAVSGSVGGSVGGCSVSVGKSGRLPSRNGPADKKDDKVPAQARSN